MYSIHICHNIIDTGIYIYIDMCVCVCYDIILVILDPNIFSRICIILIFLPQLHNIYTETVRITMQGEITDEHKS